MSAPLSPRATSAPVSKFTAPHRGESELKLAYIPGKSRWSKLLLSLVIAGGFVWVLQRGGVPLLPARSSLFQVSWWTVPVCTIFHSVSIYFRTYRGLYLLRPIAADLAPRSVLGAGLVGLAALFFAPLRMGEVVRPYLVARTRRVSFTQVMGTVAAERVIDGLFLTAVLLTALVISSPLSPLPDHLGRLPLPVAAIPAAAYTALSLFTVAFVVMAVFYWARGWARSWTQSVLGLISPRLATIAAQKIERFSDGLRFLPSLAHLGPFLRDSLIFWVAIAVGQWLTLRGCGIAGSFAESWVIVGVMGLGSLVPAGPGFFGAYQLAAYSGLAMFYQEESVLSAGACFVFINYSVQALATFAGGLIGGWLWGASSTATAEPISL